MGADKFTGLVLAAAFMLAATPQVALAQSVSLQKLPCVHLIYCSNSWEIVIRR